MQKILIIIMLVMLQSCALWPYKSDFDCEIPEGEYCKSLYEINKMTDEGKFDPNMFMDLCKKGKHNKCRVR